MTSVNLTLETNVDDTLANHMDIKFFNVSGNKYVVCLNVYPSPGGKIVTTKTGKIFSRTGNLTKEVGIGVHEQVNVFRNALVQNEFNESRISFQNGKMEELKSEKLELQKKLDSERELVKAQELLIQKLMTKLNNVSV